MPRSIPLGALDERRVQALLEPAPASGILVTAEENPAVERGRWGVVARGTADSS